LGDRGIGRRGEASSFCTGAGLMGIPVERQLTDQ
jgi:hypothetical protein